MLIQYLQENWSTTACVSIQEYSTVICWLSKGEIKNSTVPRPHDVPLKPFRPLMVKPLAPEAQETADLVNDLNFEIAGTVEEPPVKPETHGRRQGPCKQYLALESGVSSANAYLLRNFPASEKGSGNLGC